VAGATAATWDGAAWTTATLPLTTTATAAPQTLACASATACLVTGAGPVAWGGAGPDWTALGPPAVPGYAETLGSSCAPTLCVVVGRRTAAAVRQPMALRVEP
jgi:hypothetical protein